MEKILTDEQMETLIEYLRGTCMNTVESAVSELFGIEEELTQEELDHIDQEIFACETCGWWCEISEQDEDGNCEDCLEKDDEDE